MILIVFYCDSVFLSTLLPFCFDIGSFFSAHEWLYHTYHTIHLLSAVFLLLRQGHGGVSLRFCLYVGHCYRFLMFCSCNVLK